jgi:predicted deacylase
MLLYEGGEALRFDERAIKAGVRGVLAIMRSLEMLPRSRNPRPPLEPYIARSSYWVRAPESGVLRERAKLGALVESKQKLGTISDPLGAEEATVFAQKPGVVIGRTELPLVNEGDALFHVATFARPEDVSISVEEFQDELELIG